MSVRFSDASALIKQLYDVSAVEVYLKAGRKVYSFDLLSGHSCPFADTCLSRAVVGSDGRRHIQDGSRMVSRCYSASQEVQYNGVFNLRRANFNMMRSAQSVSEMVDLLEASLPEDVGLIRIHVAGDFFNQYYFDAWLEMARRHPSVLFYTYTKSLPYWVRRLDELARIPNVVLTASYGGTYDRYIKQYGLRSAVIVFSKSEADSKGLEIDFDDSHAATVGGDFALLIHGTQPKGSHASEAVSLLQKAKRALKKLF